MEWNGAITVLYYIIVLLLFSLFYLGRFPFTYSIQYSPYSTIQYDQTLRFHWTCSALWKLSSFYKSNEVKSDFLFLMSSISIYMENVHVQVQVCDMDSAFGLSSESSPLHLLHSSTTPTWIRPKSKSPAQTTPIPMPRMRRRIPIPLPMPIPTRAPRWKWAGLRRP